METGNTSTIFSINLKEMLEEKEISQAELARRIDVTPSTISLWLCGKGDPRMSKLDKICTVLHCTRSDLLEEHSTYTVPSTAKVAPTGGASRADGQQISFSSYIPKDSRASVVELLREVVKLPDSSINKLTEFAKYEAFKLESKKTEAQEKLSV